MSESIRNDGAMPATARVPAQPTPDRLQPTKSQVHAARNSLYAVRIATHSLAELGPTLPAETRRQLQQSIEAEIDVLRGLLNL
jgi:hypothetical protein